MKPFALAPFSLHLSQPLRVKTQHYHTSAHLSSCLNIISTWFSERSPNYHTQKLYHIHIWAKVTNHRPYASQIPIFDNDKTAYAIGFRY